VGGETKVMRNPPGLNGGFFTVNASNRISGKGIRLKVKAWFHDGRKVLKLMEQKVLWKNAEKLKDLTKY
jgi:hypothetical protein